MRKLICSLFLLLLAAAPVFAQDYPTVEVFGGYSLLRADFPVSDVEILEGSSIYIPGLDVYADISNIETSKLLKEGFGGSFTYNITKSVGVETSFRYNSGDVINFDVTVPGEVSGSASIKLRDIAFGAGPKFSFRSGSPLTPFAHALVGFDDFKLDVHASAVNVSAEEAVDSHTGFGLTLGGGLDVNVHDNIAIRLVQADYYMSRHYEETQNNFGFSFGVVFCFGK